ncbi:MAG: leucine-rich repeat protein [Coprococcus sp.]|nr:leucine-rich repeat protein [Coprococcus sp.]
MKKKNDLIKKIIVVITAVITILCVSRCCPGMKAKALEDGGRATDENGAEWDYWIEDDGTISLTYLNGTNNKNIIVPATLDGYKVSGVSDDAFWYNDYDGAQRAKIESIEFSEGITYVDGMWGCENLKKVVLPSTLKEISDDAFKDCVSLQEINIPSCTVIGDHVFYGCTSLEKVTLPWGLETIGAGAFSECKIKSIKIPDTVTKIDWAAFFGCSSLTGIKIPESVEEIGNAAFNGCSGLRKVTIYNDKAKIAVATEYTSDALPAIPGLTIYGHKGSTAEEYAKQKGIAFKATKKTGDISSYKVTLSRSEYTYNGKSKKPKVTIKTGRGILKTTNYTIQYKNNVNIGRATVIIKGKDKYTGTVKKTFIIRPATPNVTAKNVNGGIKVSWNRISGAKGYYVYRRTVNGKWKKIATIKSARKLYYYDKKAKSGTTYRYTVRAYRGTVKSSYKATSKIKCN